MDLLDAHAHTSLSYCASEDLTLSVYRAALDDPRTLLGRQAVTNHGFQAYLPPELAWSWTFLDEPALFDAHRARGEDRLLAFRDEVEALRDDRFLFGLEVELMGDGRLTVTEAVREKVAVLVGSLHVLPRAYERGPRIEDAFASFLAYSRDLAASGIDVIAHPFRWLRDATGFVPRDVVTELVSIAAEFGTAVELNMRGGGASLLALVRRASEANVPLALATDAHSPGEVGRLEGHIECIRLAGFEPEDVVLYDGPGARTARGGERGVPE